MRIKQTAQQYKRQTASRYLPVGAQEITSKIIEGRILWGVYQTRWPLLSSKF
jgi:hypothetical protein